jgi:O-glycosyl hydrolase/aryl-phospho-beta-D-glucosidase BglC (GH1 family)/fibronectin type 3 domain-containing protein
MMNRSTSKSESTNILNLAFKLIAMAGFLFAGRAAHAQLSMLHASGINIVDANGNVVHLQGTSLGSWLLMEPWMSPTDSGGSADMYSAIQTLDNRFGVAEEQSLLKTYQDAWVTQQDINNIKAAGLNSIRIPFWWGNFFPISVLSNPPSDPSTVWRSDAFTELDRVVNMASQAGLYVILDLHGAVGGQSTNQDTGQQNNNSYWTNTQYQTLTDYIWTQVATHYKGNPTVAAYDLLNEPANPPNASALSPDVIGAYNRIYSTVRAVDPAHMVVIEGTWGNWDWSMLPNPSAEGWTNVVYSMHEYQFNGSQQQIEQGSLNQVTDFQAHQSYNVPDWIGEFNDFSSTAAWTYTLNLWNQNNMSWAQWAYKSTASGGWGIYSSNGNAPVPNLSSDSTSTIQSDWSQWTTANAFSKNPIVPIPVQAPAPPPSCGTGGPVSGISTSTLYNVINSNSGLCLTASGASSGSALTQSACVSGQTSQQFQFNNINNSCYSISPASATTLNIDNPGGSLSNGNLITVASASSNMNEEEWIPAATGSTWTLTNFASQSCLDDTNGSTSSGTQYQQWACSGNTNQQFTLVASGSGGGGVTAPSAPTGLTSTATSSSQISLAWTASSTTGVTYSIFRSMVSGFTPSSSSQIASGSTGTTYSDTGLSASTTYYYVVEAVNSAGTASSSQTSATTNASSGGGGSGPISTTAYYQIVNQASGSCIDETGGSSSNGTVLQQWACASGNLNQEWLLTPTSNGYYEVTPHNSSTAAWNVVNVGTTPGTGMQLWAYTGGANEQFKPVLQSNGDYEFADMNSGLCLSVPNGANTNGLQLQINTCNGSASESFQLNQLGGSTGGGTVAPTGLTATTVSSSAINLSWTASTASGVTYSVFRSTTSGFTPSSTNQIASGITGTTYSDTGLSASTTYFYVVEAVNTAGSASSAQSSASTSASSGGGGTGAYAVIPAQAYSGFSDVTIQPTTDPAVSGDGGNEIGHIDSDGASPENSFIEYNGLNFGAAPGAGSVSVRVASQQPVGTLDFHLGSTTGPLIASIAFPNTGGWETYTTITAPITVSTTGVQNLYIVFTGGPNPGNFHWFQFSPATVASVPALTGTVGNTQAVLSWTASTGAVSYNIKRSTSSGGPYTTVASVTAPATTYTDSGLTNGTTYYYVVTSVDLAGESTASMPVSVTPSIIAPAAPTGLAAAGGSASITLTWTASPFATSYDVYRGTSPGGEGSSPTGTATTTTYTDNSGLQANTAYYYTVAAVNSAGTGQQSTEASAALVSGPTSASNLTAEPNNNRVYLLWTVAIGATSYEVQRGTSASGPFTTVATTGNFWYADTSVTSGSTYYYQVIATNGAGPAAPSNQVSANAAPPTNPNSVNVTVSQELEPKNDSFWYGGSHPIPLALSPQQALTLTSAGNSSGTVFNVDPTTTYQTMLGVGSSMEDTSVYNLDQLDSNTQSQALNLLVNPTTGAGMNLFRIAIGTSDFAYPNWYTYDDNGGNVDATLSNFSIQPDINAGIIAQIKAVQKANPHAVFFASPWSPPGWMKDSGSMEGGTLLPSMVNLAAEYYRKFIQAYQAQGIPIYAMTVQNEPGVSTSYPSMGLNAQQELPLVEALKAEFLKYGITTKVWIYDHNFDNEAFPAAILADPNGNADTDGVAWHDYGGDPSAATTLHNAYPSKPMFLTEHSNWGIAGMMETATYFRNWISSYNQWVSMADSNAMSDHGPSLSPFTPDATLLIKSQGADNYWAIPEVYLTGQFAKFIEPGALRISSDLGPSNLMSVAFLNPDGNIVFVLLNATGSSQPFTAVCQGRQFQGTIATGTMATYVWASAN